MRMPVRRLPRTDGKPRAIERIGSSSGKISVQYIGFKKVDKDFDKLFRSLQKFGDIKQKPNLKKTINKQIK